MEAECVLGFPGSSAGKESACKAGDPGSIPGSGRSPGEGIGYPLQYSWASLVAHLGEGNGYPLQYSVLKNSMDSMVHGVAKNWTQLSDFTSLGPPGMAFSLKFRVIFDRLVGLKGNCLP